MKVKQIIYIDSAHRLKNTHDLITKKCVGLHGHTYRFDIEFNSPVAVTGLTIDFAGIKEIINRFDHKTILGAEDKLIKFLTVDEVVALACNPTAENIAKTVHEMIMDKYPRISKLKVTVWEGYKGYEYSPEVTYEG